MASAEGGGAEEDGNNNSDKAEGSPTMMSRRLKTFGSPDLAVSIGVDEHLYHYHSLILASQSLYVDTLLSSPAARTEQEKKRISFPDITIETWEKMMKYLYCPPTFGNFSSTDDLVEIIPFYDKYQFLDGMAYCDEMLAGHFDLNAYGEKDTRNFAWLTAYMYDLHDSFPKSRPRAIKWGKKCLSCLWGVDEEIIKTLLPLIDNDNETTSSMVSTFLGRKCVGMTMNEMRDLVKQPDFPEQCIVRNNQIRMLDEQRKQFKIKYFNVYGSDDLASGYYDEIKSDHYKMGHFAGNHDCGAMRYIWRKKPDRHTDDDSSVTLKIGATDCYGSAWEIYSWTETDDEDETGLSKKVLYRWENGIFSSLVPPKFGWEKVDDDENCVKSEMWLSYHFDHH